MINNRIPNNNHSIPDLLNYTANYFNDKGEYDRNKLQEIIDLICLLLDKMNVAFRYRVFKLKIGRPDEIWNL